MARRRHRAAALAATALAALAAAAPAGGTSFDRHDHRLADDGARPQFVSRADFDRDGRADVVVGDYERRAHVLLGDGRGRFGREIALPFGLTNVHARDFDRDGDADVAGATSRGLAVLLGDGRGRFRRGPTLRTGQLSWLVQGDFDGDRRLDLAGLGSRGLATFLGRGGGRFRRASGGGAPGYVTASGRLDGDRRTDLAVGNRRRVRLLRGGPGGVRAWASFDLPKHVDQIAIGDLNGDGRGDVAAATQDFALHVYLQRPGGRFERTASSPTDSNDVTSLAIGRFDRDRGLDVAMVGTGGVWVFAGRGDGRLRRPELFGTAGYAYYGAAAGRIDRNSVDDLVVANYYHGTVSVYLGGKPAGRLAFDDPRPVQRPFNVGTLGVADFDGDGVPDLAATSANGESTERVIDRASIYLGAGDGSFRRGETPLVSQMPNSVLPEDLDADGDVDLAYPSNYDDDVTVLPGRGDGTFDPARRSATADNGAHSIAAGRFDADAALDLAVGYWNSEVRSVLLGNGDGTFAERRDTPVGTRGNHGPEEMATGDFGRDGRTDLAVKTTLDATVEIRGGHGDGNFSRRAIYRTGNDSGGIFESANAIHVADLDSDGDEDIATVETDGAGVAVMLGRGDGTFAPAELHSTLGKPTTLAVADLNGDGRLDLAAGSVAPGAFSVLLGNGDGSFAPSQDFRMDAVSLLVAADLDRDGRIDLATGHPDDRAGIAVHLQRAR